MKSRSGAERVPGGQAAGVRVTRQSAFAVGASYVLADPGCQEWGCAHSIKVAGFALPVSVPGLGAGV